MPPQCNSIKLCTCQPERDKRVRVKYKVIIILHKPSILIIKKKKKKGNFINGNTLNDSFCPQTHWNEYVCLGI